MASGSFLVGEMGLSVRGFNEHFLPELEKKGYEVRDIVALGDPNGVLISLVGQEKLEQAIEECVEKMPKKLAELARELGPGNMSANNFQASSFKTLGMYQNNETASGNFPLLAQRYLCDSARKKVDYLENKIKRFMNKKLSDI